LNFPAFQAGTSESTSQLLSGGGLRELSEPRKRWCGPGKVRRPTGTLGYVTMALTNAEKQARWRERNIVKLTDPANEIAAQLIGMDDQAKLRKIAKFINDHLKHPDRTLLERNIALGFIGIEGLSKTAALEHIRKNPAYRVEAVTADGRRFGNAVRLGTVEAAQLYAEHFARQQVEGYVTSDIIRCDGELAENSVTINPDGSADLSFRHGTCGSLSWRPMESDQRAAG
jgi:hypothetical protein